MAFQIGSDNLVGDISGCGREVAPRPEALTPVALTDVLKFLLDPVRRPAFRTLDELADRDVRRNLDEQVRMITGLRSADNVHAHLATNLADDVPHRDTNITDQRLVTVFRCLYDVAALMKL